MDSALSVVVLAVGFIVLVWTFVWVARLMALPDDVTTGSAKTASTGESAADGKRRVKGRGYGANYGLALGLVGCALFFMWPSPLLLALAAVGMFHSARAVFRGPRMPYLKPLLLLLLVASAAVDDGLDSVRRLLQEEDYEGARVAVVRRLREDSTDSAARELLGKALLGLERPDEAAHELERARALFEAAGDRRGASRVTRSLRAADPLSTRRTRLAAKVAAGALDAAEQLLEDGHVDRARAVAEPALALAEGKALRELEALVERIAESSSEVDLDAAGEAPDAAGTWNDVVLVVEAALHGVEQLVVADLAGGRLVFDLRAGVLHLDIGHDVRAALVADQQRIAFGAIAYAVGIGRDPNHAAISVVRLARRDTLRDDSARRILTEVDHFGPGVSLLTIIRYCDRVKLSNAIIALQNAAWVFPGNRRACLNLSPAYFRPFTPTSSALGDEVINSTHAILITGVPVLHR